MQNEYGRPNIQNGQQTQLLNAPVDLPAHTRGASVEPNDGRHQREDGNAVAINPDDIDFQLLSGLPDEGVNGEFNLDDRQDDEDDQGNEQLSFDKLEEIEEDDEPNLNVPRKSTKLKSRIIGSINSPGTTTNEGSTRPR